MRLYGTEGYASLDFATKHGTLVRPSDSLRRGELDLAELDLTKPAAIKDRLFGKHPPGRSGPDRRPRAPGPGTRRLHHGDPRRDRAQSHRRGRPAHHASGGRDPSENQHAPMGRRRHRTGWTPPPTPADRRPGPHPPRPHLLADARGPARIVRPFELQHLSGTTKIHHSVATAKPRGRGVGPAVRPAAGLKSTAPNPLNRALQYESPLSVSPPALVPRAWRTGWAVEFLRNRTDPSPIAKFAPPGCWLPNEQTRRASKVAKPA